MPNRFSASSTTYTGVVSRRPRRTRHQSTGIPLTNPHMAFVAAIIIIGGIGRRQCARIFDRRRRCCGPLVAPRSADADGPVPSQRNQGVAGRRAQFRGGGKPTVVVLQVFQGQRPDAGTQAAGRFPADPAEADGGCAGGARMAGGKLLRRRHHDGGCFSPRRSVRRAFRDDGFVILPEVWWGIPLAMGI